jgi:hypothetical protein
VTFDTQNFDDDHIYPQDMTIDDRGRYTVRLAEGRLKLSGDYDIIEVESPRYPARALKTLRNRQELIAAARWPLVE